MNKMRVFFHLDQLNHKPVYEWAFGEKLPHPETTSRAENILHALEKEKKYEIVSPTNSPLQYLHDTHDARLFHLYKSAEKQLTDETFYPSVFPKRNKTIAYPSDVKHAGYFCFDSGTPLTRSTWMAARWSAACAVNAAKWVESGKAKEAYALCRPPGHHASRDLFGGYCYFNNAALAAKQFRKSGKVVILDIDFHHGNGTQSIFYRDSKVLFISIHGDPKEFYPYYWGHASEIGSGQGRNYNINLPLPSGCDGKEYLRVIRSKVLPIIKDFSPSALIISAGFDTYKEDPIGRFSLESDDYFEIGAELARLELPSVIVQEGGYCTDKLGTNVHLFLTGFLSGRKKLFLPSIK